MMNFDGGAGYIISAIIGSMVMWIFNRFDRHSDRSRNTIEGAEVRIDSLEKDFLKYQAFVATNYHMKDDQREFEKAVFAKLDDIVKLINTKADKP